MVRKAAVKGQFYPDDPEELRTMLDEYMAAEEEQQEALGALCPHAGYVFCGEIAGAVFGRIRIPETVIILSPSHRAASPPLALWTDGPWETPLGEVKIDENATQALSKAPGVKADDSLHEGEHSGEVLLPFLQHRRPDVRIAVVCVTASAQLRTLQDFGKALAEIIGEDAPEDTLVAASSDMSHERGPDALETVKRNDPLAIEQMERLDPEGLYNTCEQENITMCGVKPATAMMESVQAQGGTKGVLVDSSTSADSPYGAGSYVVGYAGMIFS